MSWSASSVEIIFCRSRTVLSAWIWSLSPAARSNLRSPAAASISRVSSMASVSPLPSRNCSTSRTVSA